MARWLAVIWACALARLLFYAAMLPLWEGYDEWSHFSVVRAVAAGQLLPPRDAPVPADVQASLRSLPVPWELRYLPAPARTEDEFWRPGISGQGSGRWPQMTAYESLQAPLYYWLMAPVLRILNGCSLATEVLALRFAAVLIASFTIPLIFALALEIFADARLALGCAAVAALMPGFAFDIARVANDCLAVLLFTAFLLLAVRRVGQTTAFRGLPAWLAAGLILGLGLLTKAYFLAALVAALWLPRAALVGAAISGWWYGRNLLTTGTLTGLSESVMLRHSGPGVLLHNAFALPWRTAIDSIVVSHLYFGGWSSLMVRSWMYHVFYAVIFAAAVGCVFALRGNPRLLRLAIIYAAFWLGQLYNVVLIYSSKGMPTSMGWYLCAVIGAEVVLAVAGLRRIIGLWAPALGAALFALLDLYATHFVAIPYYTGIIRHRPNGALESLHLSALRPGLMFTRLAAFKAPLLSPGTVIVLWALYLAATVAAVVACFRFARHSQPKKQ
jgi:Dolichyl-phosphate-mannose-protein mannosyltransferase